MGEFFHGVRVKEQTDLVTAINDIDSSVIGLVVTADDADQTAFPLNTPVLITRAAKMLGSAGKSGTLWKALKAISDQCSPKIIVVRVPEAQAPSAPLEGADPEPENPTQSQLVIGGSEADGSFTGMYALLTAAQKVGYQPRVLAVPGLDTEEVTSQLCVIAQKLRAFVYASANGCKTIAEVKAYREQFSYRELMLIWPDFIAFNTQTGEQDIFPAPAYACGLRAAIDYNQGWHKSLSNVAVNNVLGISKDVFWALQSADSDANELNASGVTTLIKQNGFRFWGNRSCDEEEYIFEVYTRTSQILADTIAEAQFITVDKPLTPANVKDVVDGISRKLSGLVTAGRLLGASCWFDVVDNDLTDLRQGSLVIQYDFSPVPPIEDLEFIQTFTDKYIETAFSSVGG
jgi:hypothetical protein